MKTFHISIEAVSFAGTMLDTDDLSAIRGASWAMLAVAERFAAALEVLLDDQDTVKVDFAGASSASVTVETDLEKDVVETLVRDVLAGKKDEANKVFDQGCDERACLSDVLPHLVFAVAVVEDSGKARQLAARERAANQYQMLDIDLPEVLSTQEQEDSINSAAREGGQNASAQQALNILDQPCVKDRTRPIATLSWRSADPKRGEADNKPRRDVPVSSSFYARHEFGRTGRRHLFYSNQAGVDLKNRFSLSDSFEEIADENPPRGLPATVQNKMCVLFMDGNSFGKLKECWLNRGGDANGFATAMAEKRKNLLKGLVNYVCAETMLQLASPKKKVLEGGSKRQLPVLRFETLMWGADESVLVFPGWAYPAIMTQLAQLLGGSSCGKLTMPDSGQGALEVPLTYGIGVAIGHYKTPIRAMKKLAEELADNAKVRGKMDDVGSGVGMEEYRSFVDCMVLGGIDLPVRGLTAEREALFNVLEKKQGTVFNMPLGKLPKIMQQFEEIRGISGDADSGVPRAKLAALLKNAIDGPNLGDYRPPQQEDLGLLLAARKGGREGDLSDAMLFDWCTEAPLAPLVHMVTLWNFLGLMALPAPQADDEGEAA